MDRQNMTDNVNSSFRRTRGKYQRSERHFNDQESINMKKLDKMPLIETWIGPSKDGQFLLHKTTITTIRPMSYIEKILYEEIQE